LKGEFSPDSRQTGVHKTEVKFFVGRATLRTSIADGDQLGEEMSDAMHFEEKGSPATFISQYLVHWSTMRAARLRVIPFPSRP